VRLPLRFAGEVQRLVECVPEFLGGAQTATKISRNNHRTSDALLGRDRPLGNESHSHYSVKDTEHGRHIEIDEWCPVGVNRLNATGWNLDGALFGIVGHGGKPRFCRWAGGYNRFYQRRSPHQLTPLLYLRRCCNDAEQTGLPRKPVEPPDLRALLAGLVSDAERQVSEAELRLTGYRKLLSFADIQAADIRERLAQIEAAQ
jgi:hypothetical protein